MIDEEYLSEIINARLDQTFSRIGKGLKSHDAFNLPGGVVITGGSSALQGIDDIVKEDFGVKARIFNQIKWDYAIQCTLLAMGSKLCL